ncbi:MAG: DNA replication and repair protein RecF [Dehalococcoidia bacterium]|nr:DNA replication and repair protein RecF [Bacillota bacterium]MBT9143736.1 DNA replication and repair protein RecF [Bacillota bacterium]
MKLTAFRVLTYRCVNDSGWIDVDRLTVLVGKNQSGKTALLRALHKFNPFQDDPYNMDREWPRGKRRNRDATAPAVMVRFKFSEEETETLFNLAGTQVPGSVEISRAYSGTRAFTFLDTFNPDNTKAQELAAKVREMARLVDAGCSETFRAGVQRYVQELERLASGHDFAGLNGRLQSAEQQLASTVSSEEPAAAKDQGVLQQITQTAGTLAQTCPNSSIQTMLQDQITKWLPVFVYMDDYRRYRGSTFLNHLKERQNRNQMLEEDKTVLILMKMAGLDLDDQIAKAATEDREQRALDLNDASVTLTNEMAGRWSQEQYDVYFHADQHHFMTFVRTPGQAALVPLEEESKGFQWFFSFDLHFAYETRGELKGAVILLDDPGLHLHPKAQMDLLERLEAYCVENQLVYTTHLPFMIDLVKPERIRVVVKGVESGTVVSDNIFSGDEEARFSLLAKLGMSASQSLLVARYNLVVEGPEDYWFVIGLSEVMKRGGKHGLDDRVQITAAGSASEAVGMATFMYGQDLNVAVLFDSDRAGENAAEALVKKWLAKYRSTRIDIVRVGDLFKEPRSEATIEDLLTEEYYLPFVERAYQKELGPQKVNVESRKEPQLIKRVEASLQAQDIEKFNKGRPAKLIRDDLRNKQVADLPSEVVENFERLFVHLAKIVSKWDAQGGPSE